VYLAQATSMSTRARAKFFAARTDLSSGHMLTERRGPGDDERARELLTRHTPPPPRVWECRAARCGSNPAFGFLTDRLAGASRALSTPSSQLLC
jgi:hypothetical protein